MPAARAFAAAIGLVLVGCASVPSRAYVEVPPAPSAASLAPFVIEAVRATDRPSRDEVRVVREADGSAFAIFPDGDVLRLHGPSRADVILGPLVSPADVANAAAAVAAMDACARDDERSPRSVSCDAAEPWNGHRRR